MKSFTDEKHAYILGYDNVRSSAKNFEEFSSNLQGDRDVRDYHQLPLEVDPPMHTDYRHAIQSLFLRPKLESHIVQFRAQAASVLEKARASKGLIDVYHEIALPYVVGCLTIIYNRPQDLDEWISWGHDVWTAASPSRSGKVLHDYLARVWGEDSEDDIWSFIKATRPLGAELTEAEFRGYGSVLLAGGRDTVIKLVSGIVWHLLNSPSDLKKLKADPTLERNLINELLRFLSPLPAIERVKASEIASEQPTYFRLHFASANHDPEIWQNPQAVDIERGKQPHLAFGYGPHACIGMNLAEYEAKAFIAEFIERAGDFRLEDFILDWAKIEGFTYLADLKDIKISNIGS